VLQYACMFACVYAAHACQPCVGGGVLWPGLMPAMQSTPPRHNEHLCVRLSWGAMLFAVCLSTLTMHVCMHPSCPSGRGVWGSRLCALQTGAREHTPEVGEPRFLLPGVCPAPHARGSRGAWMAGPCFPVPGVRAPSPSPSLPAQLSPPLPTNSPYLPVGAPHAQGPHASRTLANHHVSSRAASLSAGPAGHVRPSLHPK
jgi:hypothetical protein